MKQHPFLFFSVRSSESWGGHMELRKALDILFHSHMFSHWFWSWVRVAGLRVVTALVTCPRAAKPPAWWQTWVTSPSSLFLLVNLCWNAYCPFVLKMGRASNQLKDVPVMLHYMPGLRFGISILSLPGNSWLLERLTHFFQDIFASLGALGEIPCVRWGRSALYFSPGWNVSSYIICITERVL